MMILNYIKHAKCFKIKKYELKNEYVHVHLQNTHISANSNGIIIIITYPFHAFFLCNMYFTADVNC